MILVWMPVYNEEEHLEKAINSVLSQTYTDFILVISDNHSTDKSSSIIDSFTKKDLRIRKTSPPHHISSLEHCDFVCTSILDKESFIKYTIHIGGHDTWKPNLLQTLFWRAEAEPNAAIVYGDAYDIDDQDNIIKQYRGYIHTEEIMRPFVPHHVLIGLTENLTAFGLWRESIRRKVSMRYFCSAVDHLMAAEAALHGSIVYQPGTAIYLRKKIARQNSAKAYVDRHIPKSVIEDPCPYIDFLSQLEWSSYLIDKAVDGNPHYSQPIMKTMLKNSLISAYICRYWGTLNGFEGGAQEFFNHPRVLQYIQGNSACAYLYEQLNEEIFLKRSSD